MQKTPQDFKDLGIYLSFNLLFSFIINLLKEKENSWLQIFYFKLFSSFPPGLLSPLCSFALVPGKEEGMLNPNQNI